MSAYQAQFKPSESSSCRSRPPISMRAECTPSSFHGSERPPPATRREGTQHHGRGQGRAVELDGRHVDVAAGIAALVPDAQAVAVQQHH
jgi:hypothetical protein